MLLVHFHFATIVFECLDIPLKHELESFIWLLKSRRNRMFWFANLNRTSSQSYRNHFAYVIKIFEEDH